MAWCSLANHIVKSNPLLLHLSSTFAITVWTKLNRLTPFVLWTLNLCLATQNTHGIYKRPSACKIQTDPLHLSVSSISYQLFIKVGRLHLMKRNKICKFFIDKLVGRFVLRGNVVRFGFSSEIKSKKLQHWLEIHTAATKSSLVNPVLNYKCSTLETTNSLTVHILASIGFKDQYKNLNI